MTRLLPLALLPTRCVMLALSLSVCSSQAQNIVPQWYDNWDTQLPVPAGVELSHALGTMTCGTPAGQTVCFGNLVKVYEDPWSTDTSGAAIALYNGIGEMVWFRYIDGWFEGREIQSDSQGNIYVTGFMRDDVDMLPEEEGGEFSAFNRTAFLWKLDNSGNTSWIKTWEPLDENWGASEGIGLSLTPQDEIVVSGRFESQVSFDGNPEALWVSEQTSGIFFLKTDSNGEFIWKGEISGCALEYHHDLETDLEGNVFFIGQRSDNSCDVDPGESEFLLTTINDNPSFFVLKMSAEGQFLWAKSMEFEDAFGYFYSYAVSIESDDLGNLLISADFPGSSLLVDGVEVVPLVMQDAPWLYSLLKFNSAGELVWSRIFQVQESSEAQDFLNVFYCSDIAYRNGIWAVNGQLYGSVDLDVTASEFVLESTDPYNYTNVLFFLNDDGFLLDGIPNPHFFYSQQLAWLDDETLVVGVFIGDGEFDVHPD